MEFRATIRPGLVLALGTALLLPLSACGPTADQLQAREESASASPAPSRTPRPDPPARSPDPPPAAPVPVSTAPPAKVGVTGAQAGMPETVQAACQALLRRDGQALPPEEAGNCVAAAMVAGEGGIQSLQTETSWLPTGTYAVEFATAPEFAMTLVNTELDLAINIREGSRELRKAGADIPADAEGSAEEAYAAVLADAAELTVRPERVADMLRSAQRVDLAYDAVFDGAAYTRLSGSFDTGEPGDSGPSGTQIPSGSFTLFLDDYYRPARIEIVGLNQGITSTITAVSSQWGTRPLS